MSVASLSHSTKYAIQSFVATVTQKLARLFSASTNVLYEVIWDEMTPPLKPDFCDKSIPGKCFYLVDSVYNYIFKVGIDTAGQVYVKTTSHDYDPVIYNKLKACVVDNAAAVADLIIKASAGDDRSSSTGRSPYSLFSSSPAGSNVVAYVAASDLTPSEESLVRTGFNALVEKCLNPTPSPTPQPCTSFFCTLGNVGGGLFIAFIVLAGLGLIYCLYRCKNRNSSALHRRLLDVVDEEANLNLPLPTITLGPKYIIDDTLIPIGHESSFHNITQCSLLLNQHQEIGVQIEEEKERERVEVSTNSALSLTISIESPDQSHKLIWKRSKKHPFISNPTTARYVTQAVREQLLNTGIDVDSFLNYYHTIISMMNNNDDLEFPEINSIRIGAAHTFKAAFQTLLVMIVENSRPNLIVMPFLDIRFMSQFDPEVAAHIENMTNALESITGKTREGNLFIDGDKLTNELVRLIGQTTNLRVNAHGNNQGILNAEIQFYTHILNNTVHLISNKPVKFILLNLSPNNLFGFGFGFNTSDNLAQLRAAHSLFNEIITPQLPVGYQVQAPPKIQLGELLLNELNQIANPSFNWPWFPVRVVLKIPGMAIFAGFFLGTGILSLPFKAGKWCYPDTRVKVLDHIVALPSYCNAVVWSIYNYRANGAHVAGELAYKTTALVSILAAICNIIINLACKSNKDRGSADQIMLLGICTIFWYRLFVLKLPINSDNYSILNFQLMDEAEARIFLRIFEVNLPELVTFCSTLKAGSKSLDGLNHIIEEISNILGDNSLIARIKNILKGERA